MQVSVIMPIYNAAPFLDRAIQSALEQPQVTELILIDDASTDGSAEKAREWTDREDRIKYLPALEDTPQRAAAARNRGLAVATAPFFAFLDADDYYLPNRFKRTQAYFETHPEVEGVVEGVVLLYTKDYTGKKSITKYVNVNHKKLQPGPLSFGELIRTGFQLNGLTLRRRNMKSDLIFDETLVQTQDLDLIRNLVYKGYRMDRLASSTPEVAVYVHHNSNTSNEFQEGMKFRARLEKKWIVKLAKSPKFFIPLTYLLYRFIIFHYQTRDWPKWKKLCHYPFLFIYQAARLGLSGKG